MTLSPRTPDFCGRSLGPRQHLSLAPPTAGSSGQGLSLTACCCAAISCPGPLGAAILPAMDFPAGGKGWHYLPHVAGGNCSSSGSPESAFFKASCSFLYKPAHRARLSLHISCRDCSRGNKPEQCITFWLSDSCSLAFHTKKKEEVKLS